MPIRETLVGRLLERVARLLRWRNRPDPAWKPTGIRQVYTGFDQSKASESAQRARARERLQRELERRGPSADVVERLEDRLRRR